MHSQMVSGQHSNKFMKILITTAFQVFVTFCTWAQPDAEALAKKLANPVASLISVPFQENSDHGIGDLNGSRSTLNIQPVIPLSISPKLNLITRWVQPVISQFNISGVGERQSGLADALVSAFVSPQDSKGGFTWGAGPVLLVPVGTNEFLTSKKFGIGPTVVALKQAHGWTFGALINQIWSVAGSDDRPAVNQMFVQPFINYNWKSGAGAGTNLEWTQNWQAGTTILWLDPTVSGLTSLGKQKLQLAVGPRFNLAAPESAKSRFGVRAVVVLLFPK
jgi:hypothetical protein